MPWYRPTCETLLTRVVSVGEVLKDLGLPTSHAEPTVTPAPKPESKPAKKGKGKRKGGKSHKEGKEKPSPETYEDNEDTFKAFYCVDAFHYGNVSPFHVRIAPRKA